jgi:two-component system, cell cycle sensor histidine kinase and response regulator CckA
MQLNWLTLAFTGSSAALEKPFHSYYIKDTLPHIRIGLLMGILMYGGFGILDALLLPDQKHLTWLIRYAFVCPAILATFGATYVPRLHRFLQPIMAALIVCGGLGIILMITIAPPPMNYYYYAGLILVFIFGYSFIYLRFLWATLSGWIIVILYEVAAFLTDTPTMVLISNSTFFISANTACMLVGYTIEYVTRKNYYLMHLLAEEQHKIQDANAQLELRVAERTGELEVINRQLIEDISERKRTEKALLESEERLRLIAENAKVVIWMMDMNLSYTYISPYIKHNLDYTPEEFVQKPLHEVLTPASVESCMRLFAQELEEENNPDRNLSRSRTVEVEHIHRDGRIIWAELHMTFIRDTIGNARGILGITSEITERKRAEEALQQSEKKFRDLAELLPQAVYEVDLQGRFTYVNRFALEMFGYSQTDFEKGLYALDMIAPGDRKIAAINMMKMINREIESGREYTAFRANGEEFPVVIYSTPISADDKVIGLRGIVIDITDRKLMGERLSRAEKMEALGTLAGGVAHDLNNVLGILVGYSELLRDKLPEDSSMRRYADNIHQSGIRGAAIIQDLLTLARRGVNVSEVVNLNRVVLDYLKTPEFENLGLNHPQVKVRTELEEGLLNIKGSPIHLGKTIMNLVSNAAESISGRGEATIKTENRYLDQPIQGYDEMQEGDYAVLTVTDTGSGISANDLGKIFEPFYTKKVMGRSGTGLGLAVVWGTVKDHCGYIDVQSGEGQGSTFTLYFPVTREKPAKAEKAASFVSYLSKGESILVVDDVKEQRELAASMLERLGYRVAAAAGGEEAIAYVKNNKADLVVLDMIMDPGMDGMDTYLGMIEISPGQKAIIVSGFSETDRVRQAQEMGAGAFVRKPYILEKIGLAVRKELDRK